MKIFSLRYLIILLASFLFLMPGCDLINEDMDDCSVFLVVTPYLQTPCMEKASYPTDVDLLHITLSDAEGKVVAHQVFANAVLSAESQFILEVPADNYKGGTYLCTVWGGAVDKDYLLSRALERGVSVKDIKLALKTENAEVRSYIFHTLYQAVKEVKLRSKDELDGIDKVYVAPNLRPYTYDFNVTVRGLSAELPAEVAITDNNVAYAYTGELFTPTEAVSYVAALPNTENTRSVHLRTLDITPKTTDPRLKLINKRSGTTLLDFSLKALLAKLPDYKPLCKFEYDIDIEFHTSISVVISIDGMPVHSYDIEL
ncbi:hypothetical protein HQ45_06270 [Porphyromonas crevioricanis]|uniref:Fimbrillin-A associated anchor proteins Mfa1 and Mfa2 n=2 Tax=Porphyromonas crevioricanis TaxID=393921 RepID=A0A0A2FK18_9PORP|nr:FimB/Mfa2 family fimbrial subunit [Porphyromonas crevioricanis]KGN90360.1 hypothetical protein HQ45_06270 [Porphyromonas crevioricanis]KGN94050.1 hypothetical protein HQ38_07600 [Porphyromonas crevioricanis]SJZ61054.1 Fimbrillin-A associated anchor protein Mfa1 and Mfa2 [Porphyromonas crevioricanis]SQH72807.1 Fimbrillin-A associated anchor proteins Mfa1 and Mfa2 [Porphyromonas crevioricanis]GAD05693.1 hypothetical protein PORCRE_1399 [Porphyromonas crevioricanis JCM 15906]